MICLIVAAGSAVAQTDLTPLFDPASAAEVAAVQADWAVRTHQGTAFTIERTATHDGFTLSRVSFLYDGLQQYGFLRYPRHYDPAGDFPVMIIHHGGDAGVNYTWTTEFDAGWPGGCVADSFFVLAPTYRGEACNGSTLLGVKVSDGPGSLWDRDCDDAMAMLRAFLAVTPAADPGRVFSLGRSRGAIVAAHQAVRDPLVVRSVILFAASDFRHPDIVADCQVAADGGPAPTGSLSKRTFSNIVQPWLDGQLTLAEARTRLCAWSILQHLSGTLPLQLHHGELDSEIPILHSQWMETRMLADGAEPPDFAFFAYAQAGHGTGGMTELGPRVEAYVCGFPGRVSSVDLPPLTPRLQAWPNPFQGQVEIRLTGLEDLKSADSAADLEILDLHGRRVRRLSLDGGQVRWNGRDATGRRVPAGVYLVRTKNPGQVTGVFAPAGAKVKLLVLH